MAIPATVDLVMDVVRAADPTAVEAARSKLANLSARATAGGQFRVESGTATGQGPAKTPEAFAKFEAMVLQTFLQSMLPKDTESVYGGGVAGEMWQSMLAEQLGNVMAKRGGIGIADRILSDHYREGEKIVPIQGVSSDQGKQERASSELLATAMVQEVQRSIATALDRELGPRAEADRR